MHPPDLEALVQAAKSVAAHAYVPASNFPVGAALRSDDGQIFVGCNIENASYGLTMCAERNAIAAGVAAGVQHFTHCVVHTPMPEPGSPCGACRQVLAEFGLDMEIVLVGTSEPRRFHSLADLLPQPFRFPRD